MKNVWVVTMFLLLGLLAGAFASVNTEETSKYNGRKLASTQVAQTADYHRNWGHNHHHHRHYNERGHRYHHWGKKLLASPKYGDTKTVKPPTKPTVVSKPPVNAVGKKLLTADTAQYSPPHYNHHNHHHNHHRNEHGHRYHWGKKLLAITVRSKRPDSSTIETFKIFPTNVMSSNSTTVRKPTLSDG